MFCPYYCKIPIFDFLASYILEIESNPGQELRPTRSSQVLTVKMDPNFTSPKISIQEYSLHRHSFRNHFSFTLSGQGKSLANSQLIQDKAYFEVKILRTGKIGVGVAKTLKDCLDQSIGEDSNSWGFELNEEREGSVIGCLFDQSDKPVVLSYRLNDEIREEIEITGLKGSIVPAISLENGAEVQVVFDSNQLEYNPPSGSSPIIFSQNFLF